MTDRFSIQLCGESGQGINSLGDILAKTLKDNHFYLFGYREYPSLIKGGVAGYKITFGSKEVNSPSKKNDLIIAMSRAAFHRYLKTVKNGGNILHSFGKPILTPEEKEFLKENGITLTECSAEEISSEISNSKKYTNTAIMGFLAKIFNLDVKVTKEILLDRYGKDKQSEEINREVFEASYNKDRHLKAYKLNKSRKNISRHLNINGNQATALGILKAGCRAYYHYPMTPVTSIAKVLENHTDEYGVFVFQADDEIAASQMALASYYAGTRALTATSGGGFDLMTETLSMAGMTEIPFVVILGQRPGPSTGLPTWSSDSDLNVALYGGHGDFPRIVLSVSDPADSYSLIQESFMLAEKYQVPVILLTNKHVAESLFVIEKLDSPSINGETYVKSDYVGPRYSYSEDAVPNRTLPGLSENTTITNSDEHDIYGKSTENAEISTDMQDRRMLKLDLIKDELSDLKILGDPDSMNLIISWGGTKGSILDALNSGSLNTKYKYIHITHIYPVSEELEEHINEAQNIVFIEQNKTGQLQNLLLGNRTKNIRCLRKYDGRPIYPEEVIEYLNSVNLENEM